MHFSSIEWTVCRSNHLLHAQIEWSFPSTQTKRIRNHEAHLCYALNSGIHWRPQIQYIETHQNQSSCFRFGFWFGILGGKQILCEHGTKEITFSFSRQQCSEILDFRVRNFCPSFPSSRILEKLGYVLRCLCSVSSITIWLSYLSRRMVPHALLVLQVPAPLLTKQSLEYPKCELCFNSAFRDN